MEDFTGAEDADIRRLRGKQLADLVSHWAPVYAITAEGGASPTDGNSNLLS